MEIVTDKFFLIEVISSILSLFYCIFIIRQKIIAWPFGIVASFLSISLFYVKNLYGEAFLHFYYVVVGFYGWYYWNSKKESFPVTTWTWLQHTLFISIAICISLIASYLLQTYTDGKNTVLDSLITVFSFLATYKESRKILTSWFYWIIINGVSTYLCYIREMYIYALLMLIYTFLSIYGQWEWWKSWKESNSER